MKGKEMATMRSNFVWGNQWIVVTWHKKFV